MDKTKFMLIAENFAGVGTGKIFQFLLFSTNTYLRT